MKKIAFIMLVILTILFVGCSKDDDEVITPNDVFNTYTDHWQEENFSAMYDMLTEESQQEYPSEQFIDRYQKIYEDLEITNVSITYSGLSEAQLEATDEEGSATIPFSVDMESIAGPITFNYEATLEKKLEGEEEEEVNWYLTWDPGFIFPEIKDGGEIGIDFTQPIRGQILDRNQIPLADNDEVWDIGIVPEKLGPNSKQQISELLNISVSAIDNYLDASWVKPDLYVPINKKIPKSNEELVEQIFQIDGVAGRTDEGRTYPFGEITAHLTGYIGQVTAEDLENLDPDLYGPNDVVGKAGLEYHFEDRLKGRTGVEIYVTKEDGDKLTIAEKEVQHGENIITTIDIDVQEEIYQSYDGMGGTAAAIQPKTGETLALVSSPAYDPNDMVYGISQEKWDELQNDPLNPLYNRFTATYAPGSTIKPITAAIGLDNGTFTPEDTVEIEGLRWSPNDEDWGDYKIARVSESNGPVDIRDALIRSDNIYFAMQALNMGSNALVSGLELYGFGDSLPFTYPISSSTISSSGAIEDPILLANTSYGQGEMQVSPLHLATMYSTFINSGNMVRPILLANDEHNQFLQEGLISNDQAEFIQEILQEVVEQGSVGRVVETDFPISGKTGTAELKLTIDQEDGKENGWFVGYPSDDQDILIAMMMEEVQDIGASLYVAEKVGEILGALKE
ncbi:penicillin-binding transpeptidase domain-containing protein [Ornithinibacillus halophilus]|uniref:serine-type D-Ala-D-Ala carboxypeptidase n=1 Tax=Ornithinibacillus halophilus TaxID=930117 RepID=A0A1M5FDW4_9BACI|nr:penicillin-binding transpeptidase domain-containing protein [Ornithinibacillus halophilus]SHF89744.1 penicillin-binding protein [Ornithinibacillus halophilus]